MSLASSPAHSFRECVCRIGASRRASCVWNMEREEWREWNRAREGSFLRPVHACQPGATVPVFSLFIADYTRYRRWSDRTSLFSVARFSESSSFFSFVLVVWFSFSCFLYCSVLLSFLLLFYFGFFPIVFRPRVTRAGFHSFSRGFKKERNPSDDSYGTLSISSQAFARPEEK